MDHFRHPVDEVRTYEGANISRVNVIYPVSAANEKQIVKVKSVTIPLKPPISILSLITNLPESLFSLP